MSLSISNTGLDLIKKFEGCRLTAYQDSVGVWTIGYGHTSGVKSGQTITQIQADTYLRADCANAEKAVNSYDSKYHWNQNQFDALVSFTFNLGSGNLKTLLQSGTRTITQISAMITAYNKAGGKILQGLVNRRAAEKELFDKANSSVNITVSSSTQLINTGLQHAKNFTGVNDSSNISKAKGRVLQHAMNLDYGKTITEDGVVGTLSKSKLGTHYVSKGEKQYMVTAAEILMYLNGIDPNGVELPGVYGNGLVTATKLKFGGTGQIVTASNFLTLIQ